MSRLNLPITTIIECNDKLVTIMADAVKSTQEIKKLTETSLIILHERGVIYVCYEPDYRTETTAGKSAR